MTVIGTKDDVGKGKLIDESYISLLIIEVHILMILAIISIH